MGKISSDQAAEAVGNRYDLVLIASRRARELNRGWRPHVKVNHGSCVTALYEIENNYISRSYLYKPSAIGRHEKPDHKN
jgi:DNA-directed RNA polymerase subunit omega